MENTNHNSLENIVEHFISYFNENINKQPSEQDLYYTCKLMLSNHISMDNNHIDESSTETYILTWKIQGSVNHDEELLEASEQEVLEYLGILMDSLLIKAIHRMHEDLELNPLEEITLRSGSYNKILHDEGEHLYLIKFSDNHIYITLTSSGY